MSSPIHKFLFSPPPSPPTAPLDGPNRSPALTSLRSLLPIDNLPRLSLEGNELKARSPRTPQQARFTLDSSFPTGLPTRKETFTLTVEDHSILGSPRPVEQSALNSPGHLNVPTVPAPNTYRLPGLPKPVIRLLVLTSLLVWSIIILVYIPSARLPSLRAASASRRLALASDGRAYYDVMDPVSGWSEARDREYVPPQVFANRLSPRAGLREPIVKRARAPHPPKASRPAARPLPASHELLALQSYLLQSTYNVLPHNIDPKQPLDANLVLGYAADETALEELEAERAGDVVIWYGANGLPTPPHELLGLLQAVHGAERHPTMLALHNRPDLEKLLPVLRRLGLDIDHGAIAMVGNTVVTGDMEELDEMRASGKLEQLLESIGWVKAAEAGKKPTAWKPKMARVKRREKSEVERALEQAKR